MVTPGFKLPRLWVIHVRAASHNHHDDAPGVLRQALQAMLCGAHEQNIRSLAIAAIGTGACAFATVLAARITAEVRAQAADIAHCLQRARLCLASADLPAVYQSASIRAEAGH